MFCARCGLQQASELKFCTRCGLHLSSIKELLDTNGIPPTEGPRQSPKTKGLRLGVKIMLAAAALAGPAAVGVGIAFDQPGFLFVPFTIFSAGLARYFYARWFEDDWPEAKQRFPSVAEPASLPPKAYSIDAPSTGEMSPTPSSITEDTTNLLPPKKPVSEYEKH